MTPDRRSQALVQDQYHFPIRQWAHVMIKCSLSTQQDLESPTRQAFMYICERLSMLHCFWTCLGSRALPCVSWGRKICLLWVAPFPGLDSDYRKEKSDPNTDIHCSAPSWQVMEHDHMLQVPAALISPPELQAKINSLLLLGFSLTIATEALTAYRSVWVPAADGNQWETLPYVSIKVYVF